MFPLARPLPLAILAATVAVSGCSRKRPAVTPEPNPSEPVAEAGTASGPGDAAAAASTAREAAEREVEARRTERMRVLQAHIYFAFDRSDLSADSREVLDRKLEILRSDPSIRVSVAGHADERGSDEYNLALGQRRAEAAKRYFTQRGIDAGRIATSSFGEEQALCHESHEGCWSRNRRDEFELTSGPLAIVAR